MKRIILIVLIAFIVSSCAKDPVSVSRTSNPDVPIALMFEHDGCKVYRFTDDGNHHYFAKCDNSSSISETHIKCVGKSCSTKDELITTIYK